MKILLLLLLLAFACAAAMMLLQRLNTIANQLGGLRRDVDRKNDELARRVAGLNAHAEAERARREQDDADAQIKN